MQIQNNLSDFLNIEENIGYPIEQITLDKYWEELDVPKKNRATYTYCRMCHKLVFVPKEETFNVMRIGGRGWLWSLCQECVDKYPLKEIFEICMQEKQEWVNKLSRYKIIRNPAATVEEISAGSVRVIFENEK